MRNSYRRLFEWLQGMVENVYPIIFAFLGIIVLIVVAYGIFYFYNWNNQIDKTEDIVEWFFLTLQYFCTLYVAILYFSVIYLIVFGILSLPLLLTIIALIILLMTWLILLPYILMDLVTLRYKLESSLTLFGLVIGTVGILVLEIK